MLKFLLITSFLFGSSVCFGACHKGEATPDGNPACRVQKDPFFASHVENPNAQKSDLPQLLVFVSFSMPENALKELSNEVEKVGGALVVRGLIDNSFKRTAQFLTTAKASVMIDPTLFERFQITTVPTFVYAKKISHDEATTPVHDRLMGHVTLYHALTQFRDKGEVGGADLLLAKFEGRKR